MAKIKDNQVLVPAHDHSYRVANLSEGKAVFNPRYNTWSEYHGDEYLDEGDIVVDVRIAE